MRSVVDAGLSPGKCDAHESCIVSANHVKSSWKHCRRQSWSSRVPAASEIAATFFSTYSIWRLAGWPYQGKFGCRFVSSARLPFESNAICVEKKRKSPHLTACGSWPSGSGASDVSTIPADANPKVDAGKDSGKTMDADVGDTGPDVIEKTGADATFACFTGNTDADPKFCCGPGDPTCIGPTTPDACQLDCKVVCHELAPSAPAGGFEFCSHLPDGRVSYVCGACGVGRLPNGTEPCPRGTSVAERLAMQAYYEQSSVFAFRTLGRALAAAKAPASIRARVQRAERDEKRHARLFERLARRRGATVPPQNGPHATPSLFALAIENAREGCVRETYGALVALHQARHATDLELRRAFASIADDEIAHAALSLDLARYFDTLLSAEQRIEVSRVRVQAIATMRELATRDHDDVDTRLGVPAPEAARVLFDDLFVRLAQAA